MFQTQYPDVNHGSIEGFPFPSLRSPIRAAVNDNAWLDGEFISTVQDRGAAIIKAREKSSAASAASSCVDHVRDWVLGTKKGEYVSMGVYSDGKTYGGHHNAHTGGDARDAALPYTLDLMHRPCSFCLVSQFRRV